MNDLSWIIYAADVVPKFKWVSSAVAICVAVFVLYVWHVFLDATFRGDLADGASGIFRRIIVIGVPVIVGCSLVAILTPSRETILMIAASELGETVATSEEGAQALDDIRTIVTDELARLAGREE